LFDVWNLWTLLLYWAETHARGAVGKGEVNDNPGGVEKIEVIDLFVSENEDVVRDCPEKEMLFILCEKVIL
jgi:hypothetical protein